MENPFEIFEARLIKIENLLLELLKDRGLAGADTDRWFDLTELCQYLPDKPVKATIYGYVKMRTIPHHKKSKKLSFLKSEIDEWLKTGRKKTVKEIEAATDQKLARKNLLR